MVEIKESGWGAEVSPSFLQDNHCLFQLKRGPCLFSSFPLFICLTRCSTDSFAYLENRVSHRIWESLRQSILSEISRFEERTSPTGKQLRAANLVYFTYLNRFMFLLDNTIKWLSWTERPTDFFDFKDNKSGFVGSQADSFVWLAFCFGKVKDSFEQSGANTIESLRGFHPL